MSMRCGVVGVWAGAALGATLAATVIAATEPDVVVIVTPVHTHVERAWPAGERGERIASAVTFTDENAWSFVARTYLFDRFVALMRKGKGR